MNNMCKVVVSRKKGLVLVEVCYLFFWGADASMTPGVSGKAWWWGCILESSESSLPCFLLLFLKSKYHLGSWFRTSSKSSWLAWFRLLRAGVESEMSGMLVDFLTCHCWWVKQCFPFGVSASVGTYVLQHFFTSDGAVCTRVLCSWYHWPRFTLSDNFHDLITLGVCLVAHLIFRSRLYVPNRLLHHWCVPQWDVTGFQPGESWWFSPKLQCHFSLNPVALKNVFIAKSPEAIFCGSTWVWNTEETLARKDAKILGKQFGKKRLWSSVPLLTSPPNVLLPKQGLKIW